MKKPLALLLVAPLATTTLALAQAPAEPAAPAAPVAKTAPAAPQSPRREAPPQSGFGRGVQIDRLVEFVLEPLELTAEQRTQIDQIKAAWLEQSAATREEVRKMFLEIQTLRRSPSATPAELEEKRAELVVAQEKMQAEIAKLDEQVAAALDPERREKFLAKREEMKAARANQAAPEHPAPAPKAPSSHTRR